MLYQKTDMEAHCRRIWQPTLVFLLGESHGLRSLAGCGGSVGVTDSQTQLCD